MVYLLCSRCSCGNGMNTKKYLKEHEVVFERREYKTVKSCLQNNFLRITIAKNAINSCIIRFPFIQPRFFQSLFYSCHTELCSLRLLIRRSRKSLGYTLTRPFHYQRFSKTPIHMTTTRCVVFNTSIKQGRTRDMGALRMTCRY